MSTAEAVERPDVRPFIASPPTEEVRADELEDLYGLPPVDYDQEPHVGLEAEAEQHLQQLARLYAERDRVTERLEYEVARLQERARQILAPLERRVLWHEQGLQAFLWRAGVKTWKGLYGTLRRRAGRDRVEVVDEEAFVAWTRTLEATLQERLLRTKVEVNKREAKAFWDSTGTEPPGVRIERGEDTFAVELTP